MAPGDNGPEESSAKRVRDIPYSPSPHSLGNRVGRTIWKAVWLLLYRPSPRPLHAWRRVLLRVFGAKIGRGAHPYPGAKIWAPWNLKMGEHSSLADGVDCYCVDRVSLGPYAVVSQYSFLCTASHDCTDPRFPLVTAPISIGREAWVCADVFVGPGTAVGDGAVVGARSSVFSDIPPWVIAMGTPARAVKDRELRATSGSALDDPSRV